MRTYSQALGAGGSWPLVAPGALFRLIGTDSGEPVNIKFFRGGSVIAEAVDMEAGFFVKPKDGFDRVEIYSATAQTVKILIADNDAGYDRFIVDIASSIEAIGVTLSGAATVDLANGAFTQAAATVTNASGQLVAANANRKFLTVQNKDAAGDIYVNLAGAAATTANGLKVSAGGSLMLDVRCPTGAIYAIGSIASNANIVVVEG